VTKRLSVRLMAHTAIWSALLPLAPGSAGSVAAAPARVVEAREIRSLFTHELGVARPVGVTYLPEAEALLVAGADADETAFLRLSPAGDSLGTSLAPRLSYPASMAFDAKGKRLTAVDGDDVITVAATDLRTRRPPVRRMDAAHMELRDPQGATFDPTAGTWFVLDRAARAIVRVPIRGGFPASPTRISLRGLDASSFQGLALNPADGLLYVASRDDDLLYGLNGSGEVRKTYDLAAVGLHDLRAIVFAPSADPTDDPSTLHLYAADAGTSREFGRVAEVTLSSTEAATAPTVTPTLVQTIQTSQLTPPSPDPAGITYMSATDRLVVGDSEVEEMTMFKGVNLFRLTRTGSLTGTGVTTAFSKEPTGLGFNPAGNTMYISDDNANRVFIDRTGADGNHGTSDDQVSAINTLAFGSDDAEGVEYDTETGHLFVADGVAREVYDIDPVNGAFGDGNDVITHFDVEQYGALDPEGIGSDPARDSLLVADRTTRRIYEVTRGGSLLRIIDLSAIAPRRTISGVTLAPGTDNPSRMNYWISDRGVDNNTDPNENDGKIYEVSLPSSDAPPSVSITSPEDGSTVSGTVTVQADAADDNGVVQVQFFDGGVSIGTDINGSDDWSVAWDTTSASDGSHVLTAVATDTAGNATTSAPVQVTVDNSTLLVLTQEVPVGASEDDVEERQSGRMWLANSDLELVTDGTNVQKVGLRFTGVMVPHGGTIVKAYVQFQVDEASSEQTNLAVAGEASDNSARFTTTKFNVSSRPRTTASVPWSPPAWTRGGLRGAEQRTPDISSVLQEIVDRPGWLAGNALAVIITGFGRRVAESIEGNAAPLLHIEWATP
jgi:uncharacterized protein YjiK